MMYAATLVELGAFVTSLATAIVLVVTALRAERTGKRVEVKVEEVGSTQR